MRGLTAARPAHGSTLLPSRRLQRSRQRQHRPALRAQAPSTGPQREPQGVPPPSTTPGPHGLLKPPQGLELEVPALADERGLQNSEQELLLDPTAAAAAATDGASRLRQLAQAWADMGVRPDLVAIALGGQGRAEGCFSCAAAGLPGAAAVWMYARLHAACRPCGAACTAAAGPALPACGERHPSALPPASPLPLAVYLVQGLLGLSRLAVFTFLKDDLGLAPATVALITSAGYAPWVRWCGGAHDAWVGVHGQVRRAMRH